jgi:type IV secretory pathway VirB2 component (pilin)
VGAEHGANIITAIVTIFGERKFRKHLKIVIDIAIFLVYYGIQASRNFNISDY